MNQSWSNQQITAFVRGVLGCGCPDEVFRNIDVSRSRKGDITSGATRINIGDTLLIYIVRPESSEELQNSISNIVSSGREDRDAHGFNRFRCVVAGDEMELNADIAASRFAAEIGEDRKMHLHFVNAETVDGL